MTRALSRCMPFSDLPGDAFGTAATVYIRHVHRSCLVPTPSQLTRIARIIYPYWRERRTERGGHRIIATLNVRSSFSHMDVNLLTLPCSLTKLTRRMSRTYVSDAAKSKRSAKLVPRRLPLPTSSSVCSLSCSPLWSSPKTS